MAYFDDLFLTNLREAMTQQAKEKNVRSNTRMPKATLASSSVRSKTLLRTIRRTKYMQNMARHRPDLRSAGRAGRQQAGGPAAAARHRRGQGAARAWWAAAAGPGDGPADPAYAATVSGPGGCSGSSSRSSNGAMPPPTRR